MGLLYNPDQNRAGNSSDDPDRNTESISDDLREGKFKAPPGDVWINA